MKGKLLNVEKARFDKMIENQEIRTIITALGAGVGGDDVDLNQLRYHKIIIMTDADVDGSHIRTLLLTFFYRQLPQVVEQGFLYIAQPPLYRVAVGKEETYIKDDIQLNKFLGAKGTNQKKLQFKKMDKPLEGESLNTFLERLQRYLRLVDKLESKGYPPAVLEVLAGPEGLTKEYLKNKAFMLDLKKKLEKQGIATGEMVLDEEHLAYGLSILDHTQGKEKALIDWNFQTLADFQNLQRIRKELPSLNAFPVQVINDHQSQQLKTPRELLDYFLEEGKKGLSLQRYKGLGEMNPQQLWQTTMDPEHRTLLKVRVEDVVEADEIFTVLMGDQVEPRRDFIYQHALEVRELDI
jgi:DNA gyrase subunit B